MMGCQAASSLRDDVGVGDVVHVGSLHKGIDTVVDVLLDGVVDRTLGVAGASAVIIDSQSPSAIDKLDVEAHLVQLDVELGCFPQCRADAPYLGNLAADVEMYEFQAVAHAHLLRSRSTAPSRSRPA